MTYLRPDPATIPVHRVATVDAQAPARAIRESDAPVVVLLRDGLPSGAARKAALLPLLGRRDDRAAADLPWRTVTVRRGLSLDDLTDPSLYEGFSVLVGEDGQARGAVDPADLGVWVARNLALLEARFRSVLTLSEHAISIVDGDGIVVAWNETAERLYGISPQAILGRPLASFFKPEDLWSLRAIRHGTSVRQGYHLPRPDVHVIINAAPVELDGQVVGAVSVEQDVTRLVRMNEQLQAARTEVQALQSRVEQFRQAGAGDPFRAVAGRAEGVRRAVELARRAAGTSATVLIRGESGVGKDLLAQAIHSASDRSRGPFVAINCGAIPPSLFESELFGYEPGAFTGAERRGKPGKLELAHGGTLFLDEVADLPLEIQVKLLRVLQDRTFYRVGGTRPQTVDIRVIAATNRDIDEMVRRGAFRADLYYRLNVICIELPPLRERPDDLPDLIHQFLQEFSLKYDRRILGVQPEVMEALFRYHWPGNIRELRNVIERLVVLADDGIIRLAQLPEHLVPPLAAGASPRAPAPGILPPVRAVADPAAPVPPAPAARPATGERPAVPGRPLRPAPQAASPEPATAAAVLPLGSAAASAERQAIEAALAATGGNRARAARLLGVSRATLYNKLRRLGVPGGTIETGR